MKESVRKKRDSIINIAYIGMIIGVIILFIKYAFALVAPFLVAFAFAIILQRPLRFLDKKTKNKCHGLWSILLVLLAIAIIAGPIAIIFTLIFKEISGFIGHITSQLNDFPQFLATIQNGILDLLKFLPDGIYTDVADSITAFFGNLINDFDISKLNINFNSISSNITTGISGVFSVVKNIPSALVGMIISIIAWIFFTKDYSYIVSFIKAQLPENKKNILSEFKQIFSSTVLKMLKAYGIIMFITFCEILLGLTILNLIGVLNTKYSIIIALATAIFDILPLAGSGGILITWAVISIITGNTGLAIGLLVIYAIISVVRQYIEPKIVGSSLGVHPLVTLAGLYIGLKLFGFMGMFIVPITVMTIKAFNDAGRIHLYNSPDRK